MAGDIYNRYLRTCEKRDLEPLSCVLEACKAGSTTLRLAGNCLSAESCKVLAKTLQHGHPFTELDLSDCLIGDEGLSKWIEFLKDDIQITSINLKGNSIKSKGTTMIAALLKKNTTLEKLSLEWNGIGMHESDVKVLCEGLAMNSFLRSLDLRSNHIDHTGAAHIASLLLLNNTLEELDLRWNNIGVVGGRKILLALRNNSYLITLKVEGNSIPSDIIEAISSVISLRLDHHTKEAHHQAETMQLSAQLTQLHSDAKHKMMEMLDTLDSERTAFIQNTQLSQCEIADLKAHLEERDVMIARLETRLLEVQSALRTSLSKGEEMSKHLQETEIKASSNEEILQSKIEELEKEISSLKERSRRNSMDANAKKAADETKIHSLEMEVKILEGKVAAACQERDTIQRELQSRVKLLEAQLSEKETRHVTQFTQLQDSHHKELSLCGEEFKDKETMLTRKLHESEQHLAKLEEEVRVMRVRSGEERGRAAEEVGKLEQTLKLQKMKTSHLEDQMEEIKSNHKLAIEALQTKISKYQSEMTRLEEDCTNLKHRIKATQQELESERSDWIQVKKSHKEAIKELTEERDKHQKELRNLKKQLEDERQQRIEIEAKRGSEVKVLMEEKSHLEYKVTQQKATIQRFQQEEQHRASELKAALNTYFSTTPTLTDVL